MDRVLKTFFLVTLVALVGCGGPAAAPAPRPGATPPALNLGNFWDPLPGTPLNYSNYQASIQKLSQQLNGQGAATIQSETSTDYIYQGGNNWTPVGPSTPITVQNSYVAIVAQPSGDGGVSLQLSAGGGTYGFSLVPNMSTDQVALFVSGDGKAMMKMAYGVPNPPCQVYTFFQRQDAYNQQGGARYQVIQDSLAVTFVAPTQPTYNPGQYQPTMYPGGF